MEERAADLAERQGEIAGEAMEDFGRAGGRDGPAQVEAAQRLPRNNEQQETEDVAPERENVVGITRTPLAPLERGNVVAIMGTPLAPLERETVVDIMGTPLTPPVQVQEAANTTTIIGNAGNTGNNAMARIMMMDSTGTNSSTGIATTDTFGADDMQFAAGLVQRVAETLTSDNAQHVVQALAAAEGSDKMQAFCTAVGLEGCMFDLQCMAAEQRDAVHGRHGHRGLCLSLGQIREQEAAGVHAVPTRGGLHQLRRDRADAHAGLQRLRPAQGGWHAAIRHLHNDPRFVL